MHGLYSIGAALAVMIQGTSAVTSAPATWYGGNLSGGNCLFSSYTLPSSVLGTALSYSDYNGNCGTCLSVKGPKGNSIKVMVVDKCPSGCGKGQLDLFPDAFAKLDDPNKGKINVQWEQVPCGITSPLIVRNKEGTSKYWFSMQVVNHNYPVTKFEVSTDSGKSWQPTVRQDYNYWQKSSGDGFLVDTVSVRVTCSNGKQVVVKNVGTKENAPFTATGNC
ncbi:rare lipoprotein A [Colletotrichum orchidophilum]|uniref:Rare lipoprotein A n=1 Tax=Colletotrichum orchidophilum TaxID=1209926 RepID=A0A1G4BIT7_9PEZI|nr:rare lipoprotein A [Colletotrichum orchidophilum]OHF01197.1 rare lipoprotein A [Colletotrichum orchidophilum]